MAEHLERALELDELTLAHQPVVDARTGFVTGMEALCRWTSPAIGHVDPAVFIAAAEQYGLIRDLGVWVLHQAMLEAAAMRKSVGHSLRLAVNISSYQLRDGRFVLDALDAMATADFEPANLMLEITESAVLNDSVDLAPDLAALRSTGVRVALADFGTGSANLAVLQQLEVDALKLDRGFISPLPYGRIEGMLVSWVTDLAHSLDLSVIAEGVENNAQVSALRDRGCDEVQGYLFSGAVPAAEFTEAFVRQVAGASSSR